MARQGGPGDGCRGHGGGPRPPSTTVRHHDHGAEQGDPAPAPPGLHLASRPGRGRRPCRVRTSRCSVWATVGQDRRMAVDDHGVLPRGAGGGARRAAALRLVRRRDVLLASLAANHEHLARWMPWAQEPPTDAVGPRLPGRGHRSVRSGQRRLRHHPGRRSRPRLRRRLRARSTGSAPAGWRSATGWTPRHTGRGLVTEAAGLLTRPPRLALPRRRAGRDPLRPGQPRSARRSRPGSATGSTASSPTRSGRRPSPATR